MELFAHSLRFIYRQWWFSIAILNYKRVYPIILWLISLKLYINIPTKSGHDMIYICPYCVYIYILYSVYVYIYIYTYICTYTVYIYAVVCIYIYIIYTMFTVPFLYLHRSFSHRKFHVSGPSTWPISLAASAAFFSWSWWQSEDATNWVDVKYKCQYLIWNICGEYIYIW